jgi:hypothetical protein
MVLGHPGLVAVRSCTGNAATLAESSSRRSAPRDSIAFRRHFDRALLRGELDQFRE